MARPQTELNIGQLNLSPTVQGAGKNQVFVAPLPRQNRAQMLAKNLAQFSTVLGQYSNIQGKRAEEKALRLTDKQVIAQVESNLPEKFNPFNKITFDKVFSEKRYDRYYDLEIKDKVQQMAFEIKRAGPDKIGNKGLLQDIITDGLAKIDENVLEYIGDNVHMLNRHKEVMGQVSAGMRFNENSKFEKGQVEWLKSASVEKVDIDFYDILGQAKNAKVPKESERKDILLGAIQTVYGHASIDPDTAVDQEKADRGEPGYEGFSQTVGSSMRNLIPDLSVASNYYPQGTLLNVTFEGEDKPRLFRVDDIGGMDTDKKIDFFAGGKKDMYDKFANTKIKSVEYAERNADTLNHALTKTLQYLVEKHDVDLEKSFHHDHKQRGEFIRSAITSAALSAEKNGDIELSTAIELAAPNLTFASGQKLFGSLTGDENLLALEEEKDKIQAARIAKNTKFTQDQVDILTQPRKTDIELEYAKALAEDKKIIVPMDDEQPIDPIDVRFRSEIETLRKSVNESQESKDATQRLIRSNALEETIDDYQAYQTKLESRGETIHAKTNPIRQFEADKAIKLNEAANEVLKIDGLKNKYWTEDPTTGAKSLTNRFKVDFNGLIEELQRDFYASSLEEINKLSILNPTISPFKLIEPGNDLIEKDAEKVMADIDQAWNQKIAELIPRQSEAAPKGTQFEEQKLEAKQSGLTEEQATGTALATTLKGDETFNIIDEPDKPVKIDLNLDEVFGFGDSYAGNYEIEDLDEYNLLFNNTKATGAFKGNETAVDEFVKNRKIIVKEGDFFTPLVDKYNGYVNPTTFSYNPLGPTVSPRKSNLTYIEFQTTRLAIDKRLITNGVLAEDAKEGDVLGYPLRKLIQRNWKTMSVINLDTSDAVRRAIWSANLEKEHKVPNKKTGAAEDQQVPFKEFIEAQEKLIKDQTK